MKNNKSKYLGFLGLLGFLGFVHPLYFLFFLFFLFFLATPKLRERSEGGFTEENLIQKQAKEKAEHKQKILEMFASKDKIVNDDVQRLLGVSDKTVQRYFNELQSEGKIKQSGETGRGVFYTKA